MRITVPDGLTYGNTGGKQVTYTVSPETTCDQVTWYFTDGDKSEFAGGVLPAGLAVGEHWFRVKGLSDGAVVFSGSYYLTVNPAPLTTVIDGTTTKTYDGTKDAPDGLTIKLEGIVGDDDVSATASSYTYNSADVNGATTITASGITLSGAAAKNYTLSTPTAAIPGTITKADQDTPDAPSATDENIKDTSITLNTIANTEYSKDGTTWQASAEFTGLEPNHAYTFYARLKGDSNHNPSPASAAASITTKKMMLDDAAVTVSGTYTYTGAAHTPAITVVKNGKTLAAGTDYTVSYTGNINAGKATATVTGTGSYEGTNSAAFTIRPKALTVTGATAAGRAYNGTNAVTISSVTLEGVVSGDTVSVSTTGLTGTLSGTDAGNYTAVALPAMTLTGTAAGNYTLTRPAGAVSTSVTISKAAALTPKTGDLAVVNGRAYIYTYGLDALLPDAPDGMSLGSAAVTYTLGTVTLGSYYTSGAEIRGQTLTLPIQAVDANDENSIGTITVTIHTGNFADMTATITVKSVNKIIPEGTPALSTDTLTYGQALSAITLSGSMKDGSTDVPGTFAWSSPGNRPTVQESYAAAWVFTPNDTGTYSVVNGTSTVKVVPASIANAVITLSDTAYRYDGDPHTPSITSVKLGNTTLTADVDYTAGIPAGTEAGAYTVTITGKGNYTGTAEITFTINPVEQKPLDQPDGSGRDLRLEVETGLSTVPAALSGDIRFDTPDKIETALRAKVAEVMSNVGGNIAVFDVTLQYKDAGGQWHDVDPNDFPPEGVTVILPYPAGTGMTGWTFSIQHLISSGNQAGTMETLTYELTASGLKCKFSSLSPVAIGYQTASKPVDPPAVNPSSGSGSSSGGGGSSESESGYAITVERTTHGKVTSSASRAGSNSIITLTVTPDSGYMLDTLTVTDSRGSEIKLTAQGGGKYTFTMPGRAVTVKATFAPLPADAACDGGASCPSRGYTDLGAVGTWYHEAVDYVLRNGLMNGYSNGTFGPNNYVTRAQFAQILYNQAGRPAVTGGSAFADVADSQWCAPAVTWAAANGIVGGYGDGRFGPDDRITREQLAVMLWRYAGSPATAGQALNFTDVGQVGGFALEALRWATGNGVVNGKGNGILDPKGLATRAQTAQMLKNYMEES